MSYEEQVLQEALRQLRDLKLALRHRSSSLPRVKSTRFYQWELVLQRVRWRPQCRWHLPDASVLDQGRRMT